MILAIDIGNTNIVIGGCENEKILFMERLTTMHTATVTEYSIYFKSTLELANIDAKSVSGAIISSVVPSVTDTVKEVVKRLCGADAMVIGPDVNTGLTIKIDNPEQLGSDLIVDAVAGIKEYGAPVVVIDMGTATTISVINKNGEYIGGMILPGMMISLNAMVEKTSKLPKIGLEKPKQLIGTNTVDCIKSGMLYGNASCLDGMLDRIREEIGDMTVVATGGLAGTVVPLCKNKIISDDELLIKGLVIIYNMNI